MSGAGGVTGPPHRPANSSAGSSCTRAIGHAAGLATGTYGFDLAIKPVIEIDRLLDYRASKRDRETAAQTLKIMGATIRRREDNE